MSQHGSFFQESPGEGLLGIVYLLNDSVNLTGQLLQQLLVDWGTGEGAVPGGEYSWLLSVPTERLELYSMGTAGANWSGTPSRVDSISGCF